MDAAPFPMDFQWPTITPAVTFGRMAGRPSKPIVNPPNRIREAREARGLTQEQIAKQLGVAGETIRKYETGENAVSVYALQRVAKALGVPAYTLLNDWEPERGEQERALATLFRRLTPRERDRALSVLAALEADERRHVS
jgi:transcriptional regulator with XRE-family HTH domain